MTTQYTPTLKLALPVTGELSGTWGDVVNDNITSMIEQAIAGLVTINTWTGNGHVLTTANGTTSESRCAMLVAATGTGGSALTGAGEILCPAAAKLYVLQNTTAFAITLKTSAGTGVAVASGNTAFLFCDGTNVNSCVTTIVDGNITGNLTVGGNATINGNTTLGNATTDTITATARFNTDLLPSTDNARDLGSSANAWRDLYIDGTATIATLNVTTIDTTNFEVTNIKAKDGTASITLADSTGIATFSNPTVFPAGSAAAPAITTAGDTNTGIFFPAADTIAFAEGGAESMRIDSAGNVGIGTTTPYEALTIRGTGNKLCLDLNSATTNDSSSIVWNASTVTLSPNYSVAITGIREASAAGAFTVSTRDGATSTLNERLRITSAGNVGIGTSSPTSTLSVAGTANVTGNVTLGDATTDTVTVNGYMGVGGAAAASVGVYITSSALTGVNQAGVLGAITGSSAATTSIRAISGDPATAAAAFTVVDMVSLYAANGTQGAGSTITNKHGVQIVDQTRGTNNFGITSQVSSGTNKWNFYASGTAQNYLAGNLLIGTTSIRGVGAAASGGVHIEGAGSDQTSRFTAVRNTNDAFGSLLALGKSRGTSVGSVDIVQNGDTCGQIYFAGADGTDVVTRCAQIAGEVDGVPGSNVMPGRLVFSTNSGTDLVSERMRITSAGNVGIGTSSPDANLTVNGVASFAAGTALLPSIARAGDLNTGIFFPAADTIAFAEGGVESMRLDSSGNLGLGVTPSPWGVAYRAYQVGSGASLAYASSSTSSVSVVANAYRLASAAWTYIATNAATHYEQFEGQHRWSTAPSGTAGATVTFTQAMTLDASGRLIRGATAGVTSSSGAITGIETLAGDTAGSSIGQYAFATTNAAPLLEMGFSRNATVGSQTVVTANDVLGAIRFSGSDGTNFVRAAQIVGVVDGTPGTNDMPGRLVFSTSADGSATPTERMRIDSAGNVLTSTGAQVVWAPAPASISTTATLTNANIQAQIINTTGTSYTVTMPLGTTLETLISWTNVDLGYNFTVINTASGTITMAVNTGVTSLGGLTIATGVSAQFRIRRTAANTFILYRLS